MIEIVPASPDHVGALVWDLRADDRRELEAFNIDPVTGLRQCIAGSVQAFTALDDGWPVACWGVMAPSMIGAPVAYPWLLTGLGVERHKVRFLRENRRWLAYVLTQFPRLEVLVDARYTRALTWLRRLGFTITGSGPFRLATIEAK